MKSMLDYLGLILTICFVSLVIILAFDFVINVML
jgi:hypothetical protein